MAGASLKAVQVRHRLDYVYSFPGLNGRGFIETGSLAASFASATSEQVSGHQSEARNIEKKHLMKVYLTAPQKPPSAHPWDLCVHLRTLRNTQNHTVLVKVGAANLK